MLFFCRYILVFIYFPTSLPFLLPFFLFLSGLFIYSFILVLSCVIYFFDRCPVSLQIAPRTLSDDNIFMKLESGKLLKKLLSLLSYHSIIYLERLKTTMSQYCIIMPAEKFNIRSAENTLLMTLIFFNFVIYWLHLNCSQFNSLKPP